MFRKTFLPPWFSLFTDVKRAERCEWTTKHGIFEGVLGYIHIDQTGGRYGDLVMGADLEGASTVKMKVRGKKATMHVNIKATTRGGEFINLTGRTEVPGEWKRYKFTDVGVRKPIKSIHILIDGGGAVDLDYLTVKA